MCLFVFKWMRIRVVRELMKKAFLPTLIAAAAFLALMAAGLGGFLLLNVTTEQMTRVHAERTALAWGDYVASNLARIEEIASGAELNAGERGFLQAARNIGDVFLFKLFDKSGRLRLVSDELGDRTAHGSLPTEHNQRARWPSAGADRSPRSPTAPESPIVPTFTPKATSRSRGAESWSGSRKSMSIRPRGHRSSAAECCHSRRKLPA
jgi:hypothetical protein